MGHEAVAKAERRFQVSAECCESFARTNVREETIPDSRSCRAKTSSTKLDVITIW